MQKGEPHTNDCKITNKILHCKIFFLVGSHTTAASTPPLPYLQGVMAIFPRQHINHKADYRPEE
jgi:hypothetical protein